MRKLIITLNKGFLILGFFVSIECFAAYDNIKFTKLSVTDGLSQSSGFAIVQDKFGFIWIGTYDGLNRYNGYEFDIFKHNNDTLSLPDNFIQSLCVDNKGDLWVGTNSHGVCLYNYEEDFFYPQKTLIKSEQPIGQSIYTLINYNDSTIVAYTDKGVHMININTKNSLLITKEEYLQLPNAPSLLSYFNPQKNKIISINSELTDSKGFVWQGTKNGLFRESKGKRIHYQHDPYDPTSLSSNEITCVFEDRGGVLWVGTSLGGVCKWDRINEGISLHRKSPVLSNSLSDDKIRCFYEDSKNRIWIGTVENGLNLWDRHSNTYKYWNTKNNPSLNHNHIRDIIEWEGKHVIATDGGGLQTFIADRKPIKFNDFHIKGLPQNIRVWDLHTDDTLLWIASYSHGLFVIHNNKLIDFSDKLPEIKATWVTVDQRGKVWIGTFGNGIFRYDKSGFKQWNTENSKLSDDRVYSIVPDNQGNLWIATKKGLCRFALLTEEISVFSEENGLPNNTVMGIVCDSDSSVWLSTNNGVCHLYPNTQTTVNYDIHDGLQNNEFLVHSFLSLQSGEMLFGGIHGFNVFPVKLPELNQYKPNVIITEFVVAGDDWSHDSTIFTKSVINLSHYQNEFSFEFAALSFIESNNNRYTYILEGFDKGWKQDSYRRFAQYTNVPPGNYVLKVKAANNDNIWNEEAKEIQIIIKPAIWQTLLFKITLLFLIVIALLIIIRLRFRQIKNKNLELEQKVEERTHEIGSALEKLKITQNQLVQSEKMASIGVLTAGIAHEINNPVTFISVGVNSVMRDFEDVSNFVSGISKLGEKQNVDIHKINSLKEEYDFDTAFNAIINTLPDIKLGANRITEIVSGLSKFSRIASDNWQQANIHDEIDSALVLLKNKCKAIISIEKHYCPTPCLIECIPGKINQVFMNIINNAIDAIGDEKGTVKITTIKEGDNIIVKIKDTGQGIDEELQQKIFDPFFTTKPVGKGLGLGLSISYSIIQEHEGKLNVSSKKDLGTEFIIKLPVLQKSNLKPNE